MYSEAIMIKNLWKYTKGFRGLIFGAMFLTFLEVVFQLLIPLVMADVIDIGIRQGDVNYVLTRGVVMLGLAIASLVAGVTASHMAAVEAMGIGAVLRDEQFKSIQGLSFSQIDSFKTGSFITRLTTDITRVQMSLVMFVRMFVRAPMMFLIALILAVMVSVPLSKVFFASVPVLVLAIMFLMYKVRPLFTQMQERMDEVNLKIQENLTAIRVVKSFDKGKEETADFMEYNRALKDTTLKAFNYMVATMPLVLIITFVTTVGIIYVGGVEVAGGGIDIGQLSTFLTYINQIMFALIMMTMVAINFSRSNASLERIFEVINSENPISQAEADPNLEVKEGSVEFKDVYFKYFDTAESYVLCDINLKIEPGMKVGILGGTGSGKSTLVQMIPRLYEKESGEILIDGKRIETYSLDKLRKGVSMVLQKNTLFEGTVAENLRLGREDATDQELWKAIEISGAKDFVEKLPGQLDYKLEQEAANLSGGQKQRLCIARAILTRPKIIILDDSTSAVDTATERVIQKGIEEELKDTTVITIAQRVSSVEKADLILVIDGGKIVDRGVHEELLDKSEIYREVYQSQQREVAHG